MFATDKVSWIVWFNSINKLKIHHNLSICKQNLNYCHWTWIFIMSKAQCIQWKIYFIQKCVFKCKAMYQKYFNYQKWYFSPSKDKKLIWNDESIKFKCKTLTWVTIIILKTAAITLIVWLSELMEPWYNTRNNKIRGKVANQSMVITYSLFISWLIFAVYPQQY